MTFQARADYQIQAIGECRVKGHLGSWILVAAMMAVGFAWSINAFPQKAPMAAAEAQGAREAAVIDRHALQRARRGWDIAAARGGFASDRLGFERYEDVDPPWVRQADVAESVQSASDQFKEKNKVEVEVQLDDGRALKGSFFLGPHQRVLDALNDERAFLPFEDSEGTIVVIRKARISHIIPVKQKPRRTKAKVIPLSHL